LKIFEVHLLQKFERKSKKGQNSVKMLDRVTSSCLQVGVMMVNKYMQSFNPFPHEHIVKNGRFH
jgi:hypothetical protein